MRMNECGFTYRVYESMIEGRGVWGRPPVKWINKVEEYWRERELAGEVCKLRIYYVGLGCYYKLECTVLW